MAEAKKEAAFAAGCFWGVEKEFNQLEGVADPWTDLGFLFRTGGFPGASFAILFGW